MFFLEKGCLEEVLKDYKKGKGENFKTLREIEAGEVFCLYSFFSDNAPENSVISKGFSSIYEIKKEDYV